MALLLTCGDGKERAIYGADESDDWTDPKVWKKANPSLGITVGIDKVKAVCESARQNPGLSNDTGESVYDSSCEVINLFWCWDIYTLQMWITKEKITVSVNKGLFQK